MSEKTVGEVMSRAAWRHDYIAGKIQKRKRQEENKTMVVFLYVDFITDQKTPLKVCLKLNFLK